MGLSCQCRSWLLGMAMGCSRHLGQGNRLGCVPRMSPLPGDMGGVEACWEQRWGWQSAAAFLCIGLLGSWGEILPLGHLPCTACVVLYLWADRKRSLLHAISMDQQEKNCGLGRVAGRGAHVEAAWGEAAKQHQGRFLLYPLLLHPQHQGCYGLMVFPKASGFPKQPRYEINHPPSSGCISLPSPSPAPSLHRSNLK